MSDTQEQWLATSPKVYEVLATKGPLPAKFKTYGWFVSRAMAEEFREQIRFLPDVQSTRIKEIDRRA